MSGSDSPSTRPSLTPDEDRRWASLAHFGTVLGFLPPLLVLLLVGPRSRFVRQEAREALNLAVTALIVWAALAVLGRLCGVFQDGLPPGPDLPFVVLVFLLGVAQLAVWLTAVVLAVVAGLRVQHGGGFRHPLPLRLVRRPRRRGHRADHPAADARAGPPSTRGGRDPVGRRIGPAPVRSSTIDPRRDHP